MKKACLSIALLMLSAALLLGACSPAQAPASKEELQKFLHFGGGSGMGTPRVIGTALSTLLNKYTTMEASVETVPGTQVYPLMNTGDIDLIFIAASTPLQAWRGEAGLKQTRIRDLAAARAPAATVAALVTLPSSGIKTAKDLRGKAVHAEDATTPWYVPVMDTLLKVNGMTRADIKWLKASSPEESMASLVEKRVDAIMLPLGDRTSQVKQTAGAWVIPFSPEEQAAIAKVLPEFTPFTAPKGLYQLDADTPSVASPSHMLSRAALNDITAYTIMKTLHEHLSEFHQIHPVLPGFTLDSALSHMVLPVHPGAIRYYKEAGIWTPQHEAKQQQLLAEEKKLFGD